MVITCFNVKQNVGRNNSIPLGDHWDGYMIYGRKREGFAKETMKAGVGGHDTWRYKIMVVVWDSWRFVSAT